MRKKESGGSPPSPHIEAQTAFFKVLEQLVFVFNNITTIFNFIYMEHFISCVAQFSNKPLKQYTERKG